MVSRSIVIGGEQGRVTIPADRYHPCALSNIQTGFILFRPCPDIVQYLICFQAFTCRSRLRPVNDFELVLRPVSAKNVLLHFVCRLDRRNHHSDVVIWQIFKVDSFDRLIRILVQPKKQVPANSPILIGGYQRFGFIFV